MLRPLRNAFFMLTWIVFSVTIAILFHFPIIWALISILAFSMIIGTKNGFSFPSVVQMASDGSKTVVPVILSLSAIGILIGTWLITGILPYLMGAGFQLMAHANILLTGFLTCALISMMMGTAIGTLSTAGLVFLGIGASIGVPLPLLVGSLASGAYLGDRTSPLSSGPTLATTSTDTPIGPIMGQYFLSLTPAFILTALSYYFVGDQYSATPQTLLKLNHTGQYMRDFFHIGPEAWIPPLILLIMTTAFRQSIVRAVSAAVIFSIAIGVYHGVPLPQLFQASLLGYTPPNPEIASLVHGGGLASMSTVLMIVLVSGAFNGVLQTTGVLDPLLKKLTETAKTTKGMMLRSAFLALTVTLITCNQSLTILVTGRQFSPTYDRFKVNRSVLSRVIADFGVVTVPLIPWNVNAILVSSLTGITAVQYGPWSLICWLLPIISLLMILLRKNGLESV